MLLLEGRSDHEKLRNYVPDLVRGRNQWIGFPFSGLALKVGAPVGHAGFRAERRQPGLAPLGSRLCVVVLDEGFFEHRWGESVELSLSKHSRSRNNSGNLTQRARWFGNTVFLFACVPGIIDRRSEFP